MYLVTTFHALQTGERETVLRRPREACLQTYLKFTLDTAQVLGFAASLCTAGSQGRERQQGSHPDRCFWSLYSTGFLLSGRF